MIDLTAIFKALANERRLDILKWLKEPTRHFVSEHCDVGKEGVCVGLIEAKSGLSQSTVSHYLMVLERAGLITMERKGQWTYCKRNEKIWRLFIEELKKL